MKILCIGDVAGDGGCDILLRRLSALKKQYSPDLTVVNGENATGRGISRELAERFFFAGADVITLGNHAFANPQIIAYLDECRYIVRPQNLSPKMAGLGYCVIDAAGARVCVCNLLGRLNMDFKNGDPFAAADHVLQSVAADIFVFDFHANETSEKKALGYHLDGRASVVFGTHTHVQTADGHILPGGTGFICDAGMTGPQESVIGVKYEQSVSYFLGHPTKRFEGSNLDCRIQGAIFTLDGKRCTSVTAINFA